MALDSDNSISRKPAQIVKQSLTGSPGTCASCAQPAPSVQARTERA